jgi:hypothetical protein
VEQYHGVPPYRETHAYVARVIKDFNRTKLAARAAAKRSGKAAVSPAKTHKTGRAVATKPQAESQKPAAPVAN